MTTAGTIDLTLSEIEALARAAFVANGCDEANCDALVRTVVGAERDGSTSHGLFRVPGYIEALRSGKVRGAANPAVTQVSPAYVRVDGDRGYAPLAIERGVPVLAAAAETLGIAAMVIGNTHHLAALWPETEALAERGLVAMACVRYVPVMAPFGARQPLFGTNPLSFAWPRPGRSPMVIDMATSSMAQGEIQVAARDGRRVPAGTGLDAAGEPTNDPQEILRGMLLPFGAHKGSAIALMVELLAAGATGERFSFEAAAGHAGPGAPSRGGEWVMALAPEILAGPDWAAHCEQFFARYDALEGARLPGSRRHSNRQCSAPRQVNRQLVAQIRALSG